MQAIWPLIFLRSFAAFFSAAGWELVDGADAFRTQDAAVPVGIISRLEIGNYSKHSPSSCFAVWTALATTDVI